MALCLFCVINAFAQNVKVTGRVTDEAEEAIIGAAIKVVDSTIGTISDYDGNFVLDTPREPPLRSLMWAMHPSGYKLQRARLMRSY